MRGSKKSDPDGEKKTPSPVVRGVIQQAIKNPHRAGRRGKVAGCKPANPANLGLHSGASEMPRSRPPHGLLDRKDPSGFRSVSGVFHSHTARQIIVEILPSSGLFCCRAAVPRSGQARQGEDKRGKHDLPWPRFLEGCRLATLYLHRARQECHVRRAECARSAGHLFQSRRK